MDEQTRADMAIPSSRKAGYEYLTAYKITVPIYDYTVAFCDRCSSFSRSPRFSLSHAHPQSAISPKFPPLSSPRTHDQMIQAARSGMQNIPEGYKQQGMKGYIKLAGVSRGSLEELLNDYLSYGRQHGMAIWEKQRVIREIGEIGAIWRILRATPALPDRPNFPDLPRDPEATTNLMITLINQANYMIDKLIISLKEKHAQKGGLTEELYRKRKETRGY
jgi:four helix bundle suffix protein